MILSPHQTSEQTLQSGRAQVPEPTGDSYRQSAATRPTQGRLADVVFLREQLPRRSPDFALTRAVLTPSETTENLALPRGDRI